MMKTRESLEKYLDSSLCAVDCACTNRGVLMRLSPTARTAAIASVVGVALSLIPGIMAYGALDNTVQRNSESIKESRIDLNVLRERQATFNTSIELLRQSDIRQEEMLRQILKLLERNMFNPNHP